MIELACVRVIWWIWSPAMCCSCTIIGQSMRAKQIPGNKYRSGQCKLRSSLYIFTMQEMNVREIESMLMRTRPDLPRGKGTFDWWRLDVGDPASNQTRFEVLQPLHHCSVGYQPSTTWLTSPRRLFLQANRRTQARKDKHAIWNCRYGWSKDRDGVQTLITKGLIATVV
jgi:hypothetical protein